MAIVAYLGHDQPPLSDIMEGAFGDVPAERVRVIRSEQALADILPEVRVLMLLDSAITDTVAELVRTAPNLRWMQLCSSGYDRTAAAGLLGKVLITHAPSVWAPTVAEHAMAMYLALIRSVPALVRNQAAHAWRRAETSRSLRTVSGRTAAVIGAGQIGGELAQRLSAFGVDVVGVTRSGSVRSHEASYRRVEPVTSMLEVLGEVDSTFLCVPLTPATVGFFGEREFQALQPNAYFVNVSRGETVDHAALVRCLRDGVLAGCGLDVTDPEPLEVDSELWDFPQVLISPHVGGHGGGAGIQRLRELVEGNLGRWERSEDLRHVLGGPSRPRQDEQKRDR